MVIAKKKEKSFYPFVSLQVIVGGALGAAMAAGWMAAGSFLKPLVPGPLAYAAVYATSRRAAAGRAELLANFFGGAVWGNFRENANCGDPPG